MISFKYISNKNSKLLNLNLFLILSLFLIALLPFSTSEAPEGSPSQTVERTASTNTFCSDEVITETEEICYTDYCVDYNTTINETTGEEETICIDLRENYCRNNTISKTVTTCNSQLYSGRMNYLENGEYIPINTTITPSSTSYDYEMITAPYQAYFQDTLNTGEAVKFEKDGYYFIYDLSGGKMQWVEQPGNPTKTKSIGSVLTSTASILNDKVYYNDSFLNTDVYYEVFNEMLKEHFILSNLSQSHWNDGTNYLYLEYTGEIRFSSELDIYANGENQTKKVFQTSGKIEFKDSEGNTQFFLPAPTATMANGTVEYGYYNVKPNDNKLTFGLRVNKTFLETAVFPVDIDPTIKLKAVGYCLEDVYADKENPDTNYGSNVQLRIDDESGSDNVYRAYIKYNISEFLGGSVNIINSILHMSMTSYYDEYLDAEANIYELSDQEWTEENITWNNPATGVGNLLDTYEFGDWGGYSVNFNITTWLSSEVSSGHNNISFKLNASAIWDGHEVYYISTPSKEHSTPHYLEVTYTTTNNEYNISSCAVLNDDGGVYYLTQDIINSAESNCIDITANNIRFEGQGHTIDGNDAADYGIRIERASSETTNVTIKNCTLTDWDSGNLYLRYADGNNLTDLTLTSSPDYGVYSYRSKYNTISNSTIKENTKKDIYFNINDITQCNNKIENVLSSNNYEIKFYNSSVTLSDEIFSELILCNANHSTITNVSIIGSSTLDNNGIYVDLTHNLTISDVNSSNNYKGIDLGWFSSSIKIINSTMNNNNVTGIDFSGVSTQDSSDNVVNNSNINNNGYRGIRLYDCSNNYIYNNSISNNSQDGISIGSGGSNFIFENKIENNGDGSRYGIYLQDETINNVIYNNLFNNTLNFLYDSSNKKVNYFNTTNQTGTRIYSSGTNMGGNYYTNSTGNDYSDTCPDIHFSGFCDSPYNLTTETSCTAGVDCGNNVDYLPLSNNYDDGIGPKYSNNGTNDSSIKINDVVKFYANWSDTDGLSHYIFSWNHSGVWENDSAVSLTSWSNVTKTITATHKPEIQWKIYANDTPASNWNNTGIQTFTITNTAPTIPTSYTLLGTHETDNTPAVSWTKGTDADEDTIYTIIYLGTAINPTEIDGTTTESNFNLSKNITHPTYPLTDGTTYYYRLRSWDGTEYSSYTAYDGFRLNSKPDTTTPSILPALAYSNTDLNCSTTYTDSESDSGTVYFEWFKEGVSIITDSQSSIATGTEIHDILNSGNFSKDDNIICQIYSNDGYENEAKENSTAKTISNLAPTIQFQNTFVNWSAGHTFNVTAGIQDTDGGTDIIKTNISTSSGTCEHLSNTTNGNYFNVTYNCTGNSLVSTDIIIGFTDSSGSYIQTTLSSNTYPNQAPTDPTDLTGQPASLKVTDSLAMTASGGSDADGDSITYHYKFYNVNESNTRQDWSATNSYTIQISDAHDTIRVYAKSTTTDANSSGSYSETDFVDNTAPVITTTQITVSQNTSSTYTYDYNGTDADSDTIIWSDNTSLFNINSNTGIISDSPDESETGTYSILITASDGGTDTDTFTYTITDTTNPTYSNLANNGTTAKVGTDVNWSLTLADGYQLDYFIFSFNDSGSWANSTFDISGTSYFSNITKTIATTQGKSVCAKFYFNDTSGNENITSNSCFTVVNTAPTTPSLTLNETIKVNEELTANASGSTDSDSNSITYYYQFYNVNDATERQGYSVTNTYTIQTIDAYDKIRVRAKAYDGASYSSEEEKNITVANSIPTIQFQNTFVNASAGHDFNVTAGIQDLDGGSDIKATNISSSSGSCVQLSNTTSSNYFNVTFNCSGTALVSTNIIIGFTDTSNDYIATTQSPNTYPDQAPTTPTDLTLTAGNIKVTDTLAGTCTDSTDTDGDSITYFYQFYNSNNTAGRQAYSSDNDYVIAVADAHDEIRVRCIATTTYTNSSYDTEIKQIVNTAPTTPTLTNPDNNDYINSIMMNWTTSIDADSDTINYHVIVNGTQACYTTSLNCSYNPSDAYYEWNVTAFDGTVNGTTSSSRYFTYDITNPLVTITHPTADQFVRDTIFWVNGTATEINGDSIVINDSKWGTNQGTYSAWYFQNTSAIPDGNYVIKITANDTAGNPNSTETVNFTVDKTNPSLSITTSNNTLSNTIITIEGTASDTNTDTVYSNNTAWTWNTTYTDWKFTNSSAISDGNYHILITANDSAGNTQDLLFNFTYDTTIPTPSNIEKNDSNIYINDIVKFSTQWSDTNGLSHYIFSWNNSGSWENDTALSLNLWSNITKTITATHRPQIDWKIYANDSVGNINDTGTQSFNVNNTAPTIPSLTHPSNESVETSASVDINWSVSTDVDLDSLTYYIYFSDSSPPDYNGSTANLYKSFTGLTDTSTYYWYVIAGDLTGNSSNSEQREFKIDTTAPTVTFVPPTPDHDVRQTDNYIYVNVTVTHGSSNIDTCILLWNSTNNYTMSEVGSGTSISCFKNMTTYDGVSYTYEIKANTTGGVLGSSGTRTNLENTKPTITNPSINNSSPYTNDILNCDTGTLSDDDGDSVNESLWRWYADDILNATTQTLDLSNAGLSKDVKLRCSQRVADGYEWSILWYNSTEVTILNSLPTTPTLTNPDNNDYINSIMMNWTTSIDADSDTINYHVVVNGTEACYTTDLNCSYAPSDAYYQWNVTAFDGTVNGTTSSSRYYTYDTTAPRNLTIGKNDSNIYVNDVVKFYTQWSDVTGLSHYIFSWNHSGSWDNDSTQSLTEWSNVTKTITATHKPQIDWKIYANDSFGYWNDTGVQTLTILNSAPTLPVQNSPGNDTRQIGNSVTLDCSGSTDLDGDTITYLFIGDDTANPFIILQNTVSTTYTWTTVNGQTYYWKCRAEDGTTTSSYTAIRTFKENTHPALSLTYPGNDADITVTTTYLNWTSSDVEDSVTNHLYLNSTRNSTLKTLYEGTGVNYTLSIDDGTYYWKVISNDSYENTTVERTFNAKIPPLMVGERLSSASGYTDTAISIYANCSDTGSNVSSAIVSVYDPNAIWTNYSMTLDNGTQYTKTYTPSTVGNYNFSFYCLDYFGNIKSNETTNLTFTSSTRPVTPPGGGGAPRETEVIIITTENKTKEQILEESCGDGVCQDWESFMNCRLDCPFNIDTILSGENLKQYWFVNFLLLILLTGLLFASYKSTQLK